MTNTLKFTIVFSIFLVTGMFMTLPVQAVMPPPSCTNATPDGDWTIATSGVRLTYANGVANATQVYFPTWTDAGGQDDILWYPGSDQGGGVWLGNVDLANHSGISHITVHVYVYNSDNPLVLCDTASFTRLNSGQVNVNSQDSGGNPMSTSWTFSCVLTNPACPSGPLTGTNTTSGTYSNVPFSTWTIIPAPKAGYTVTVTPDDTQAGPN